MKTPFKWILAGLILILPLWIVAQDYVQYETIYLKPDTKHLGTLQANMKAHNDKYHSDAPYHANVWQVSNGPKAGWLVWAMGPCTFSENDGRPGEGGHDEDWANNVMPYITDMGSIEYWRRDDDLSVPPDNPTPMIYIRFWEVRPNKGFLMGDLWEKISETHKSMGEGHAWSLFENEFRQGDLGRHFAETWPMNGWSDLDQGNNFRAAFEKIYGEAAWTPFFRTMNEAFVNSYDEIWTLMPGMSAPPPEN
ncbi:MAG: hypothetical protein R3301_06035 [Saprospiraceae bacterium]|nr:hypothetical protein [Saprospiraceae bacterium]